VKIYTQAEAAEKLKLLGLDAYWQAGTGSIQTEYTFGGFTNAIEFMVESGKFAERTDHHPDWSNTYNKVKIRLSTHSSGGITDLDFALATAMHAIYIRENKT